MCWSLRVYWTVLHNLFARFFSNLANKCSANTSFQLCCCCCCCGCCEDGGSCQKHQQMTNLSDDGAYYDPPENHLDTTPSGRIQEQQHDYVIVGECLVCDGTAASVDWVRCRFFWWFFHLKLRL